jgi:hypothetical protein
LCAFCELLEQPVYPTAKDLHYRSQKKFALDAKTTHVSFDNYSYLFEGLGEHRGEFADIFLHDRSTRTLVCIEAKLHGDWNYQKDIKENARRVAVIAQQLGDCHAMHCVLIKKQKWLAVQMLVSHPKSQWKLVLDDTACSTRFYTWEQFVGICSNTKAGQYLEVQLHRDVRSKKGTPASRYRFKNGWMEGD